MKHTMRDRHAPNPVLYVWFPWYVRPILVPKRSNLVSFLLTEACVLESEAFSFALFFKVLKRYFIFNFYIIN